MIGYGFCGSFCTLKKSLEQLKVLCENAEVLPILSPAVRDTDTRFYEAEAFLREVVSITGRDPILTIREAEPLGPKVRLDALILSPCTGNTLAKLSCGITDTSVTMAAKAHLRSDRPLVIALASNDAMSANLRNIGTLLERKCVYFVPMSQDDPAGKPHSLVCHFDLLLPTLSCALEGKQLMPVFR